MFKRRGNIRRKYKDQDIAPDEIFLDSQNSPGFDQSQFEGRLEKPIAQKTTLLMLGVFALVAFVFLGRMWNLQISKGEAYLAQSENNRLDHELVFAKRGVIYDRNGVVIASNNIVDGDRAVFPERVYATSTGLGHILGYITYPQKDSSGFYFQETAIGREGVEGYYDTLLAGENGSTIVETDALGDPLSESTFRPPLDGEPLHLSIDARVQNKIYQSMRDLAADVGFVGGASVVIDVTNGEILALVSFPEYDPQIMTDGENTGAIETFLTDTSNYFLNRATSGLYTPGSVIKPYVAVGALDRKVIDPYKTIYSSGELVVPNPFNPEAPTIFKDWKAHGAVNMWDALAVSSNVYFFHIGGGFEGQAGIGISGIEEYTRLFHIAEETGIDLPGESGGTIPNPEWKEEHFPGDPWRVGDTYNTSIGQYGFQVTPLQMARAVAAIANNGLIVDPHLRRDPKASPSERIDIDDDILQIVREGMRQAVLDGTAKGLSADYVHIAAKTGTAELGATKKTVNSWVTGFFPYENPRYAFATVMEKGPVTNTLGGLFVMRQTFDWMRYEAPEYFE